MAQSHYVDFFDSMTMANRTELCEIIEMKLHDDPTKEDWARVQVQKPIRKQVRVPINCLVCKYTGQRLPFTNNIKPKQNPDNWE